MARACRRIAARLRGTNDDGQVTPFVVILVVALIGVAGLVYDGGMALSAKTQALDEAEAAARIGAQQLDLTAYRTTGAERLDPARARTAATAWLARADLDGTATATPASVTVTVHATSHPQLLGIIGVHALHVIATATATPRRGVTTSEP